MSSVLSVLYLAKILEHEVDATFTNVCQDIIHISPEEIYLSKHGYYYLTDFGHFYSYQILISCNVFVFAIYTILQLKRTERLGYVVIMISEMVKELMLFFNSFGVLIFIFFACLRAMSHVLKKDHLSFYNNVVDSIDAFIGRTRLEEFKSPWGITYILTASYVSRLFLFSILISMFIFRYKAVWKSIEAKRRTDIIKLKNSQQYDPQFGAISMSYFPINLILLPFLLPIYLT